MYRRRVLRDERAAGVNRLCPQCGRPQTSLPELYFDEKGLGDWLLGFYCFYDRETFASWAPEYQPLIDEITKGVDVSTLPLWPEGHMKHEGEL